MASLPRGVVAGAGLDAVRVVVVGFGAGDGFGRAAVWFLLLLLLLLLSLLSLLIARGQVDERWGPTAVEGGVEVFLFVLVEVGAWVCGFVFEHFHEAVEGGGEEGAEDGSEPVDPVVVVEGM